MDCRKQLALFKKKTNAAMETFISILRGINVSGHKKIQMTELKALYEELKFKEIITYIQSGNVIFKANKNASNQNLSKRIEKKINEKYNFIVPVIIRTVGEIENILSVNPFTNKSNIDTEKLHITFLAETPKQENV